MSDRNFETTTKAEVIAAQRAWAKAVIAQDVDGLLALYDFGTPDEPLLFKPTLADVVRLDEAGARSYFIGNNPDYPNDGGFLNHGWKRVEFQSAAGPVLKAGGLGYKDMGHYIFVNGQGDATRADYTFAYHKLNGRVLISLHHSSLTWIPPVKTAAE
ncbi:MAG: phosphoribosyl-AMP cyclohydrolase [Myxococcota bacterium]